MRIVIVEDIVRFSIPLGTTYIASVLRQNGHDVSLVEIGSRPGLAIEAIRNYRADAVAFSVNSGIHTSLFAFARRLKKELPEIINLFGGPHMTFFPETIEHPWVDALCIGEGEHAVVRFANDFDAGGKSIPEKVPNFWIKKKGKITKNPLAPRIRDLDALPYPARDLYYEKFPFFKSYGVVDFMAHRGCPNKCSFCFNEGYNQMYRDEAGDSKIYVSRSPESICDEIMLVNEKIPVRMVNFVDDIFTLDKKWVLKFSKVYGERCRIPFRINTRFDNIDSEIIEALSGAGLHMLDAGVDSGDEYIRNHVMQRRMKEEDIVKGAAIVKKYGVRLATSSILGAPGEDMETAFRTLKLNLQIKPDFAGAEIFAPYPKLAMTDYAIEKGYFDGDFDRLNCNYYHETVLTFKSDIDKRQIVNLRYFFSLAVRYPALMFLIRFLLKFKPNAFFCWLGDFIDGIYLKRLMPYRLGPWSFLKVFRHYLKTYRQGLKDVDI